MKRPSRDWVMMRIAEVIALRSTCSRAQVGVVVAREGRVLVTGYNGAPAGMPHCEHGVNDSQNGCMISVHAEANSIAFAARYGINLQGATLYTTLSPCLPCAQLILNAGIYEVVYGDSYRIQSGVNLLSRSSDIITREYGDWTKREDLP